MTGLKFQSTAETLAQGDGPGRIHPLGLFMGRLNGLLDLFVTGVTIQVILPQSEVYIESVGHLQTRPGQRRALLFKA